MKRYLRMLIAMAIATSAALAGPVADPADGPVLEAPTLHSLGVYWVIGGDDNCNAVVEMHYRKDGQAGWSRAMDLFRVEKDAEKGFGKEPPQADLVLPAGAWLLAGSVIMLDPDTAYELKLVLRDPDGGEVERTLKSRTIAEPRAGEGPVYYVVPGDGGGTGAADDPYQGLTAAHSKASPGDTFVLRSGVYHGPFVITRSGEPGKPIIWRGAQDGEAVIEGQPDGDKPAARGIDINSVRHVWLENLTVRAAEHAIVARESAHVVIRRCHLRDVTFGITATRNNAGAMREFFISDNVIEGPSTWPRTKGIEDARGIQITGTGHVVCYNRIRAFADAIDTFPSRQVSAIDFHHNDVSELTDDGIEMDYSYRNTRCFLNRITNAYQGISTQPVYGGPVYVFRNQLYNIGSAPFKMHSSPSGALMIHNTVVKNGPPAIIEAPVPVRNCVWRNNLFVGTNRAYAFRSESPMVDCDFDYCGFAGGPFEQMLKWNKARYASLDDVRKAGVAFAHARILDAEGLFASGVTPPQRLDDQQDRQQDVRLAPTSGAIDGGIALHGFNDNHTGKAPDLGAFELGAELPHYGPRPESHRE